MHTILEDYVLHNYRKKVLLQINLPQIEFEPKFRLSVHMTREEETFVTSRPLSVGKGRCVSIKNIHHLEIINSPNINRCWVSQLNDHI